MEDGFGLDLFFYFYFSERRRVGISNLLTRGKVIFKKGAFYGKKYNQKNY